MDITEAANVNLWYPVLEKWETKTWKTLHPKACKNIKLKFEGFSKKNSEKSAAIAPENKRRIKRPFKKIQCGTKLNNYALTVISSSGQIPFIFWR